MRMPPASEPRRMFALIHRFSNVLLFAVLPFVLTLSVLGSSFVRGPFLYDFKGGLYGAGHDILRGEDPYRPAYLARQAALKRAGKTAETVISVPVYPAPALVAAVPFSLLPYRVAGALFVLLGIGAFAAALWLLSVRDWRCYGLAFMSWPVLHGLMLGAVTPLLAFAAAVAWRYRARLWPCAIAVASLVSVKLFPWPLAIWLLATRRTRAFLAASALALVATLGAWAAIGFDGLVGYPSMLGDLSFVSEDVSVSPVAGFIALGLSAGVARAAALAIAGLVLAVAWLLVRRPDGDRRAFGLAVIAALVASPMLWPHYMALLFVPIALASRRLSPLWFVPLLAYIAPVAQTTHRPWVIVVYLALPVFPLLCLCSGRSLFSAEPHKRPAIPATSRESSVRVAWNGPSAESLASSRVPTP
jgi:hypothetical protein